MSAAPAQTSLTEPVNGKRYEPGEARALAQRLNDAADEVEPPQWWAPKAFRTTFGYPPPEEHCTSAADLKPRVKRLLDEYEKAEAKR